MNVVCSAEDGAGGAGGAGPDDIAGPDDMQDLMTLQWVVAGTQPIPIYYSRHILVPGT